MQERKNLVTKNNKMMAFVDLEDLYGEVEVVVFPNVYERCREAIEEDNVVVVKKESLILRKKRCRSAFLLLIPLDIDGVEEKLSQSSERPSRPSEEQSQTQSR